LGRRHRAILARTIGLPLRSVTTIPASERCAEVDLHMLSGRTEDVAAIVPVVCRDRDATLARRSVKFTQRPKARHSPVT